MGGHRGLLPVFVDVAGDIARMAVLDNKARRR